MGSQQTKTNSTQEVSAPIPTEKHLEDDRVCFLLVVYQEYGLPDYVELSGEDSWCRRIINALELSLDETCLEGVGSLEKYTTHNHVTLTKWLRNGMDMESELLETFTSEDFGEVLEPTSLPNNTEEWMVHYFGSDVKWSDLTEHVRLNDKEEGLSFLDKVYNGVLICWEYGN